MTSATNADGVTYNYGTRAVERAGAAHKNYGGNAGVKTASVTFDYKAMNACTTGGTVNVPVPAGVRVVDVKVICETLWTSTGTNTFEVGLTGGDVDAFLTTTTGTIANMTAGAVLLGDGVSLFGATDTAAREFQAFATADTIDIVTAMSDWTAGTATLIVSYI